MHGTMVCSVADTPEARGALELAVELSERLKLRLVLAHVSTGITLADHEGDGGESVSMKASREGAIRLLARLAAEYGVSERAERREAVGDEAAQLGQIAAEEAADVILVGARPRGRLRRGFESKLADQLESETSVPVLIAAPRTRGAVRLVAANGGRR